MADKNALLTWFRIQPSPLGEDIAESLRSEARDGLWLLARQWQLGEFAGEDAGTAAFSYVSGHSAPLQKLASTSMPPGNFQQDKQPLNTEIEKLPPEFSLDIRMESGRRWQKMLLQAGFGAAWDIFRKNAILQFTLPSEEPDPDNPEWAAISQDPYRQMLAALAGGRIIDGKQLLEEFSTRKASDFLSGSAISKEGKKEVDILAEKWIQWLEEKLGITPKPSTLYWDPTRLEYRAWAAASLPEGAAVIDAPEHHGQPMNWYTWEQSQEAKEGLAQMSAHGAIRYRKVYIPREVTFPGMPRARWWEMEDGGIDLGNINAASTDTGLLLLTEFSLLYSNDWLLIPFSVQAGHLTQVSSLRVTDVFGVQSTVSPATSHIPSGEWDLFHLNGESSSNLSNWLFLPSSANNWLQSAPLEEIHFIRDEMANMVWAMENIISDGLGNGTDGKNAAKQLEDMLQKLSGNPEEANEALNPNSAQIRYVLGNTVPPNWIPFVPVRLAADGSSPKMVLRRAAIPRLLGNQPPSRIRPRTQVLRELVTGGRRHDIEEEEIPVTGLTIRQVWRRARWTDGKVITWLAREKTQGRHFMGSGLQFDQVVDK